MRENTSTSEDLGESKREEMCTLFSSLHLITRVNISE
jgi:hypothetical protein